MFKVEHTSVDTHYVHTQIEGASISGIQWIIPTLIRTIDRTSSFVRKFVVVIFFFSFELGYVQQWGVYNKFNLLKPILNKKNNLRLFWSRTVIKLHWVTITFFFLRNFCSFVCFHNSFFFAIKQLQFGCFVAFQSNVDKIGEFSPFDWKVGRAWYRRISLWKKKLFHQSFWFFVVRSWPDTTPFVYCLSCEHQSVSTVNTSGWPARSDVLSE